MARGELQNANFERLYRINYIGIQGFVPGRNAAGEQILLGVMDELLLVAIFFSPEGRYLRYDFRPVERQPDPSLPEPVLLQLAAIFDETKRTYMGELGMTPGDIRIHHFAFPDWEIGIAEWPLAYFPEVRRALAAGQPLKDPALVKWQRKKRWVMHWKKEYWMHDNGEIGDT
jgi:hypothetical protein